MNLNESDNEQGSPQAIKREDDKKRDKKNKKHKKRDRTSDDFNNLTEEQINQQIKELEQDVIQGKDKQIEDQISSIKNHFEPKSAALKMDKPSLQMANVPAKV